MDNFPILKADVIDLEFSLPTKNGEIDFEFMETFIQAQKKMSIQKVIAWRDQEIAITKKIVQQH